MRADEEPEVLATDRTWLPTGASSKNFESEFVLDLDAFRRRRRPQELKLPPVVGHLQLAEEFQRLLDTGEARREPRSR